MAKHEAIKWIVSEAKRIREKYPTRFKTWKEYVAQASAIYASKHGGKSPIGKPKPKGVGTHVDIYDIGQIEKDHDYQEVWSVVSEYARIRLDKLRQYLDRERKMLDCYRNNESVSDLYHVLTTAQWYNIDWDKIYRKWSSDLDALKEGLRVLYLEKSVKQKIRVCIKILRVHVNVLYSK